jgi:hypothetical protein
MTLNEDKINELVIYLSRIFPKGVYGDSYKNLVIKKFQRDLDIIEINSIVEQHNDSIPKSL